MANSSAPEPDGLVTEDGHTRVSPDDLDSITAGSTDPIDGSAVREVSGSTEQRFRRAVTSQLPKDTVGGALWPSGAS